MVEMTEAANILHNATARSLVLLDEIGRGTSTFDGLSLAWAMARDIATRVRAFTLFATHYFELTTLAAEVEGCANVHLDATEHGDGIVFLHAVKEGPANRSYGLQVAQLAGVPLGVIGEARRYLEQLESQREAQRAAAPSRARGANRVAAVPAARGRGGACASPAAIDPDELTPKAALAALYRLQGAARTEGDCDLRTARGESSLGQEQSRLVRHARRHQHPQVAHRQHDVIAHAGHARLAHRDGTVVVLVELREQLPHADRLRAGNNSQLPRVRPAPLARLQQLLGDRLPHEVRHRGEAAACSRRAAGNTRACRETRPGPAADRKSAQESDG